LIVSAMNAILSEISVIFPAYNEEDSLRTTIDRALDALKPRCERFEIIIVNDCSRDSTGRIADELAAAHPEITVLHNPRNLGQGGSLRLAFQQARYKWVTHNGVDYPFDLCDLDLMAPLLAEADIVVAVRKQRAGYTAYRKLISHANVALLNAFFNLKLRDYSFIQICPKWYLESVPVISRSTGFLMPEILIRAHELGLRVKPVDIEYHPRLKGVATAGNPRIVLHSLMELLRFWALCRFGGALKDQAHLARKARD
jgi:glycosyltransferase involved in cell wall biosynthesis